MRLYFAVTLFSLLWATHECAPRRLFMLAMPRTGVRSHLATLQLPERTAESSEPVMTSVKLEKKNIAAMARDNLFPPSKRFEEDYILTDGDMLVPWPMKRDYGEELGPDAAYNDARDKNDRREYKRDEEAMPKGYGARNHEPFPVYKHIRYGQG